MRLKRLRILGAAASTLCAAASAVNAQTVYWTDLLGPGICRANVADPVVEELVEVVWAQDVSLDLSGGKMYWTDGAIIERADLDGSNVELLVDLWGQVPSPRLFGIALDPSANKMYWVNSPEGSAGKIQRADLNGSDIQDIVTGLVNPHGIALDLDGGKVYWTAPGPAESPGCIWRADLDGSNPEEVVAPVAGENPAAIAIDSDAGKMYWIVYPFPGENPPCTIRRADLDGSGAQDLVTFGSGVAGLALDTAGGKMYWTNLLQSKIERANLNGSNVETVVGGLTPRPWGIAVDPRGAGPAVPAVSEWGLAMTTLLALVAGTIVFRLPRGRPETNIRAIPK